MKRIGLLAIGTLMISACTVAHKRGGSPDAVVETYRRSGQFQSCYKQAAHGANQAASGVMVLAWKVDQSGRAKNARIVRSDVFNPELETCLLENLNALKFPPQPLFAPAFVEYELAFDRGHASDSRVE